MPNPFDIAEAELSGGTAVADNPFDVAEAELSAPPVADPDKTTSLLGLTRGPRRDPLAGLRPADAVAAIQKSVPRPVKDAAGGVGEMFGYAGNVARALPADLAALATGPEANPEAQGNLSAAIQQPLVSVRRGQPVDRALPIDEAIQAAREQEQGGDQTPWATAMADISQGLAKTAPKLAVLPLAGESAAAQAFASGGLFGLDDQGNFSPKEAVIMGLLPGVGAVTRKATAASIAEALARGVPVNNPLAQKVIEEIGHQAGLNAYMTATELPALAEMPPEEQRKALANIVGTNLAFGLLGVKNWRKELPSQTQAWIEKYSEGFSQKILARVVAEQAGRELGANIEAGEWQNEAANRQAVDESLRGFTQRPVEVSPSETGVFNNPFDEAEAALQAKTGENPPVSEPSPEIKTPPEATGEAEKPQPRLVEQQLTDLKAMVANLEATIKGNQLAQPKAISSESGTAAASNTGLVDSAASPTTTPAETPPTPAAGEPVALVARPAEAKAPAKRRSPFVVRPRPDGIPDILDAIQELGGMSPLDSKVYGNWRDAFTGPARMLLRKDGRAADKLVDDLNGKHAQEGKQAQQAQTFRVESVDDLIEAVREATAQREKLRTGGGGPEAQAGRFWSAIGKEPAQKHGLLKINVDQLQPGDKFRLRGPGHSHEELEVRSVKDGMVTLKDGAAFGWQEVPEGTEFWVQKKGLEMAARPEEVKPTNEPANAPGDQQPGGKPATRGAVSAVPSDPGILGARERMERRFRAKFGNPGAKITLTAGPARVFSGLTGGRSVAANLQSLADVFGKRVVWFRAEGLEPGRALRGISDGDGKYLFINSDFPATALGTTAHELLHALKRTNPGLYAEFKDALLQLANPEGSRYEALKRKAGYQGDLGDELVSDFAAHSFNDPQFLKDLAKQNPGVFRSVVNRLVRLIDRVLAKLKRTTRVNEAAAETFKDLQTARSVLVKALNDFAEHHANVRNMEREGEGESGGKEFKAKNATLKPPGIVDIGGPADFSLTAHHGTPHKVDRFRTDKIGTGEGAQVYGWGLYFAENENVAEQYRKQLSAPEELKARGGRVIRPQSPAAKEAFAKVAAEFRAAAHLNNLGGAVDERSAVRETLRKTQEFLAIARERNDRAVQDRLEDQVSVLKTWVQEDVEVSRGGNKYTVTLNAEPEDLLDWDKPLSQQSEKVKAALAGIMGRNRALVDAEALEGTGFTSLNDYNRAVEPDGSEIYGKVLKRVATKMDQPAFVGLPPAMQMQNYNPKAASEYLASLGIKGIRYLDQGSRVRDKFQVVLRDGTVYGSYVNREVAGEVIQERNLNGATIREAGTYNYVIFSDKDITITHENGKEISPQAAFSTDMEDLFGAPESVAEQRARMEREAKAAKLKKAKEQMQDRAAARLTSTEDTRTADMFAAPEHATTRQDKAGQGSLFSVDRNDILGRLKLQKPIKGQNGTEIVGYEWRSMMGEKWSEREGGYIEARVSNWDNSDKSTGTGRDIVHVFYVKHPDGTIKPEGIRSAQNVLGINETRLMTIAKRERAAQEYREQQDKLDVEAFEKVAKDTPAEAARDYRVKNYSPMRTFEENNEIFNQSVLFEKDGKFVRRGPNATDRMQRFGWNVVGGNLARPQPQPKTTNKLPEQGSLFSVEGGRDIGEVREELTAAEEAMREAIRVAGDPNRAGTKEEAEQAKALATARVRELQDELATHPQRYTALSLAELRAQQEEVANRLQTLRAELGNMGLEGDVYEARGAEAADVAEKRGEIYRLLKDARTIDRELRNRPERVAEVLKRADELTKAMRAAKQSGDATAARHAVEELMALQDAEFARIDPTVLERVRKELEAKGEIAPVTAETRGRTLGELAEWLQSKKLDSPKLTWRERVNLAKRLAQEFTAGKDLATKAAMRAGAMWRAFVDQWKAPKIDDAPREVFKRWSEEKQVTGIETHQWRQAIRQAVPVKLRRQAISVWLDAEGDAGLLRFQRDSVPERWRPVYEAALKLTADEKALALKLKQDFQQKLLDGQLLGLIQQGRAKYGVPQVWEMAPKSGDNYDPSGESHKKARNPLAKLDPRDPFFALQRTHDSYFDGIMAGGVPRSLDIADLVGVYNVDFHGALADRAMIRALREATLPDGSKAVQISGGAKIEMLPSGARIQFVDSKWKPADAVTEDGRPYRTVDHWALRGWKFAAKDATGNNILVQGDFLVHPDLYKTVRNLLEAKSALRDPEGPLGDIAHLTNAMLNWGAFLKASKFASATFHGATLAEHMMTHAFSGKPSRERLGLLNPWVGGVKVDPAHDAEVASLIRNGMDLGFGGQQGLFEEGLTSHGGIWSKVPGLGDGMAWLSESMFKEYLPRLKVKMGKVVLHANQARYGKELSPQQIAELTANQVNAAFGGQNWALLGRSKTFLDVNRLFLTAPDFLLSRAKVVGQAMKPYNREQLFFIGAQAAIVYALSRVLNWILDDDPHWEPENALRVIHKGRAYSARFIVNDMFHAGTDPAGFASGRLGPWPRSIYETITGRDMRTGSRKDIPIDTENPIFRSTQIMAKDLAEWLIPVGAEGLMPGATGREQTSAGQFAVGLLGVGSQRYTPETEMYQLAAKFNRDSPDPKAQLHQKARDDGAKTMSVYRKLDVLLEAADWPAAWKEYQALVKDGHAAESIAQRYRATTAAGTMARPFTGSAVREKAFKASLTPDQRLEYDRAVQQRKDRELAFRQMLAVQGRK